MNATLRDKYLHDGPASDYPPYKWLLTVTGQTHSSFMAQLEKGNFVLKEIERRGLLAQCTESMEDGNIKRKLEYKMGKLAAGYKLLFFQEYLISYSPHLSGLTIGMTALTFLWGHSLPYVEKQH